MEYPPQQGDVTELLAPGQTNPEGVACVLAWAGFKNAVASALPGFTADMDALQGQYP